jgi:para-nitrobenzyl esterase
LNISGGDANCGIWDQLEALRWINSEIHRFGGDPNQVTICGESAGGMSCGVLLASPLAQPFFQRAILMSGALSNAMTHDDAAALAREFCECAGVEECAEALRDVSAQQLLAAQGKMSGVMPFQPCVDGELVPELPLDAVVRDSSQLKQKQVMLGTTADEAKLFRPFPAILDRMGLQSAVKAAASQYGPSRRRAISTENEQLEAETELRTFLKHVRKENRLTNWGAAYTSFLSASIFHGHTILAAQALSRTAEKVFVYSFNFDAGRLGAAHASELPLLFGTYRRHWLLGELSGSRSDPDAAEALSRTMMACFGSFVRTGSPAPPSPSGSGKALHWPEYMSGSSPSVFIFDRDCDVVQGSESPAMQAVLNLNRRAQRPFGLKDQKEKKQQLAKL